MRLLNIVANQEKKWLASPQAIEFSGAVERNRTSDLLITNQLLYQLSYNSINYCK